MSVKKKVFKTVGLFTSSNNENANSIGEQIEEILSYKDITVLYDSSFSSSRKINKLKTHSKKYISDTADLVIAIGGDGAMLGCSREYGSQNIPILGINLGKLGFLTDIAPDEITSKLLEVLDGKYVVDKRFFLETKINNKKRNFLALNEVVIHSGTIAKLIEFDLFIDNKFVYRQKADGLIINSPTGSTAYSLSGNGPIVSPEVKAITLLPMFPHSLNARTLISGHEKEIRLIVRGKSKAFLSMDSHVNLNVTSKDEVLIKKAATELTLIHPLGQSFFSSCRNKLGWSLGVPAKNP